MKDILIIQHEDDTPAGTSLEWMELNGLSHFIWRVDKDEAAPNWLDFKAVIICGGSMDVFEVEKYPWLKIEKKFISDCIILKKPIFGLCLGSQLLAELLGGSVYPLKKWEAGFVPVQLINEESVASINVFHWHQCGFDLPPGAQLIATNDFWPNQAFKYEPNIVGTQFHPEATKEWVIECADEVQQNQIGLVQTKSEMLSGIPHLNILKSWYFTTLTKWYFS